MLADKKITFGIKRIKKSFQKVIDLILFILKLHLFHPSAKTCTQFVYAEGLQLKVK